MKVIVDASCFLAILLGEEDSKNIISKTKGAELLSPNCLPHEIGNALSAMIKRHRIDTEIATKCYEEFKKIPIKLVEPNILEALKIAGEENHYAYDAYYIICAKELNIPILSLDNGLIEIAKKRGLKCL